MAIASTTEGRTALDTRTPADLTRPRPPSDVGADISGNTDHELGVDVAFRGAPGIRETMAIAVVSMLLTGLFVSVFSGYWERVAAFGDSASYREIATSIVRWDFEGVRSKYTWGYPYLGAALVILTPLTVLQALVVVSWLASLTAVGLAQRLWGGWVAGYFAITSIDWIQHSVFGGSDAPATAFTFAAFLAARKGYWAVAALVAGLAATVRPQAALVLVAIGLVLLARRDLRTFAYCVLTGLGVVVAYVLPVWAALGDPLANYRMYKQVDFPKSLFGFPFKAAIEEALAPYPWSQKVIVTFWIVLVLVGLVVMIRSARFRAHAYRYPVEPVYVALTSAFYFTYNSPSGFQSFARYTLTLLPLVYFALMPYLPRHRAVVWSGAILMPFVVGASAMNVRRTLSSLLRVLRP